MPTSKMQAEFVGLTKVKEAKFEERQDFLEAIIDKVNAFDDDEWGELSEDAQLWVNAAVKAVKKKKPIPEFSDVGSVPKDEDEEDDRPKKKKKVEDEEEDEPAPKKKKREEPEEEEDEPAPKKKKREEPEDEEEDERPAKKKKREEPEDEEEDEPAPKKKRKVEEDEEEDEPPRKKKREEPEEEEEDEPAPKKKRKVEEEEEEDEPAPKKKKKVEEDEEDEPKKKPAAGTGAVTGVKAVIKAAIVDNTELTVDEIVKKLSKKGETVSKVTVSNVRADFRHSLKVLKDLGKLKGVDI